MNVLLIIDFLMYISLLQDGFKDDSLRIMRDIERMSSHCQVCIKVLNVISSRMWYVNLFLFSILTFVYLEIVGKIVCVINIFSIVS